MQRDGREGYDRECVGAQDREGDADDALRERASSSRTSHTHLDDAVDGPEEAEARQVVGEGEDEAEHARQHQPQREERAARDVVWNGTEWKVGIDYVKRLEGW